MATAKTYNKGEYQLLESDDLQTITRLATDTLKQYRGKPATYPNDEEGLKAFMDKSIAFFEYVNRINADIEPEKRLIPDIEAWCLYLGISRNSLFHYGKRSGVWSDAIEQVKTAIMTAKKQLALRYKIPALVFVFDSTNNHGYVNSNEFHLSTDTASSDRVPDLSVDELEQIATQDEPPQLPKGD